MVDVLIMHIFAEVFHDRTPKNMAARLLLSKN